MAGRSDIIDPFLSSQGEEKCLWLEQPIIPSKDYK